MPTGDEGKLDRLGKAVKKRTDKIQDELDKLAAMVKKATRRKRKPRHK
jgi:hypothetical protein